MSSMSEEAYLQSNNVPLLVDNMLQAILSDRPANLNQYLRDWLGKPQASATASGSSSPPPLIRKPTLAEHVERFQRRCLLIGCGAVGMACAYSIMIQGIFDELILHDVATEKTQGEAMDLMHGIPFVKPMKIKSGAIADGAGADIVVITAGVAQKPGETRLALVQRNASIFSKLIPEVVKHCPNAILLIVSNPVDVLTYITWKLSGFPPERVIGSGTVLDSARFRMHISEKFGLSSHSIHAYIIGEHGDSEVPAWSKMNVAGQSMYDPRDPEFEQIYEKTKKAAYEIIQKKGSTSYAIGLAVSHIVKAVLSNSNQVLTVSRLFPKYDCCLAMPTIVNARGAIEQFDLQLSQEEKAKLEASAKTMRTVLTDAGY